MSHIGYLRHQAERWAAPFRSKFPGVCVNCQQRYHEGTLIRRMPGNRYAHRACRCPECGGSGYWTPVRGLPVVCACCEGTGETTCPNVADAVLCAYDHHSERFIPECGCVVHDPGKEPS